MNAADWCFEPVEFNLVAGACNCRHLPTGGWRIERHEGCQTKMTKVIKYCIMTIFDYLSMNTVLTYV